MAQTVHLEMTANGSTVEGESTVTSLDRAKTIECVWFTFGARRVGKDGGLPSESPTLSQLRILKRIDKSSPLLQKAFATSETIEGAFKFYRTSTRGDGVEEHFLTFGMKNARISYIEFLSPHSLGKIASLPMMEYVEFAAGEITYTYESTGAEHAIEFFAKKK